MKNALRVSNSSRPNTTVRIPAKDPCITGSNPLTVSIWMPWESKLFAKITYKTTVATRTKPIVSNCNAATVMISILEIVLSLRETALVLVYIIALPGCPKLRRPKPQHHQK